MTEAEWLAATDTYSMLEFLWEKASDRKSRLFAVACLRRPYYVVADVRHQRAILLAERMADETVDGSEWESVYQPALELWRATSAVLSAAQRSAPRGSSEVERMLDADMATAAGWACLERGWEAAHQVTSVDWSGKYADEPQHQMTLLREIFGNPFRAVAFDPLRRTADVMILARGIYEEKAFARMPILADALQDAGCDRDELLNHLRDPNAAHVRGCWALDLVLGKE
jgi:hypothetical protein